MKQKRYWLRGLLTGLVIYVLAVLIVYVTDNGPEFRGLAALIIAVYSWPVILVSLLVGWAWGNLRKMLIPIFILIILLVVFLPLYNGRVVCGINPEKGCWNMKVNLIGYIRNIR